jgi:hypothetical protein
MHEDLLRGFLPANVVPVQIQLADAGRIEPPQRGIGRRDQIAIRQPDGDIAGTAHGKPAGKKTGAQFDQQGAGGGLIHD